MKIGFILNISLKKQGPSVHLLEDIISTFYDHDVIVVQKSFNGTTNIIKNNRSDYFVKVNEVAKVNLVKRYLSDIKYSRLVKKVITSNKLTFDAIFIQSSPTAFFTIKMLKKISKAKLIYNIQDLFPENLFELSKFNKYIYFIFTLLNKSVYRRVDKIITISHDIKNHLLLNNNLKDKINVIYNWPKKIISTSPLTQFNIKEKLNISGKKLILYAGNLGVLQNPKILIDVFMKLDDSYALVIIGEGTEKKALLKTIKDINTNNIYFFESQPIEFMSSIYAQADINFICLKKRVYKTALPSKLAFCLATNKPLILTVDNNSEISRILLQDTLTKCINPDEIDLIVDQIKKFDLIDINMNNVDRKIIFNTYFNNNVNPLRYRDLILEILKG
jgi:hypothetical protein